MGTLCKPAKGSTTRSPRLCQKLNQKRCKPGRRRCTVQRKTELAGNGMAKSRISAAIAVKQSILGDRSFCFISKGTAFKLVRPITIKVVPFSPPAACNFRCWSECGCSTRKLFERTLLASLVNHSTGSYHEQSCTRCLHAQCVGDGGLLRFTH